MPVTVHVAPQRRDAVDVRVAVAVVQIRALGVVDHQRRLLRTPGLLLGERMPQMAAVCGGELGGVAHARERISGAGRNSRLTAYVALAPPALLADAPVARRAAGDLRRGDRRDHRAVLVVLVPVVLFVP